MTYGQTQKDLLLCHQDQGLCNWFRTDQPDYSFLPDQDFDWTYSVYGDVHEILPDDMPEPLGKAVVTTVHGC